MSKNKKKHKSINKVDNNVEVKEEKIIDKENSIEDIISKEIENRETNKKVYHKEVINKKQNHYFVHGFLFIVLMASLVFFITNLFFNNSNDNAIYILINSLLLVLFTIMFVSTSITYNRKNKSSIFISSLCLFAYFIFGICTTCGVINFGSFNKVLDFSGSSLTEVVKWAEKNNIELNQEYEYSDMITEYSVISQDIKAGTKVKDIKNLTVSVSEGPNPSKEVIVPNMVTWDDERVLNFIKENYLSNVIVEFVESDEAKNTVIEQNKSGNLKRDEELKLTFSYGEELGFEEVKLIDFTGMSKFEVEFYFKKHQLRYEFLEGFSKKIKRGLAMKQNIDAGEVVKVDDERVKVTISKGPKIKVPDLTNMSMSEITDWVIKNKLKLEFTDKYDDSVEDNNVISASHKKGDVVKQGDTIKIVLSKGNLKMPKFKTLTEFRDWADKYEIKYEEKHEFSDEVEAGEVIEYSYKTGDIIKNNDVIIITISDGKKLGVPNLKGKTKKEISNILDDLELNYNFVYKYSDNVKEGKAISQSISAGSEVSKGTTITITLSKGESPEDDSDIDSNNSSSSKPSTSKPSTSKPSTPKPSTPSCDTSVKTTVYIYDELFSSDPAATCSNIKKAYSKVKFSCTYKSGTGMSSGLLYNSKDIDAKSFDHCNTVTLIITKN